MQLRISHVPFPPESHSVYQAFNEARHVYGYSSLFQLSTEPSILSELAGYVLQEIINESCNGILADQDHVSFL